MAAGHDSIIGETLKSEAHRLRPSGQPDGRFLAFWGVDVVFAASDTHRGHGRRENPILALATAFQCLLGGAGYLDNGRGLLQRRFDTQAISPGLHALLGD